MDEQHTLTDCVQASMADVAPEPRRVVRVRPVWCDAPSPVSVSRDAMLAHTGADPPPGV